jgi:hypothetical protein
VSEAAASAQEIDRILARGLQAATNLDAAALEQTIAELLAWQSSDEPLRLSAEQLTDARSEISRFRELCRFLYDSLNRALFGDESYGERGAVQSTERPVLLEKYG